MTNETLIQFVGRKSIGLILILLSATLLPLTGCSDGDGDAGPMISSLTTPTEDATTDSNSEPSLDDVGPNLGGEEPMPFLEEEGDVNSSTAEVNSDPNESDSEGKDLIASLPTPPHGTPIISMSSTPTGATANLTWESTSDPKRKGYYVYYGKLPSESPGDCSYQEQIAVDAPPITIADLEPNTPYFFAVSAYNKFESPCSNEITAITPPAGT
jgi:fibronectin type III domain protein